MYSIIVTFTFLLPVQVKNIFYHSVKDAVAALSRHLKEQSTEEVKEEECWRHSCSLREHGSRCRQSPDPSEGNHCSEIRSLNRTFRTNDHKHYRFCARTHDFLHDVTIFSLIIVAMSAPELSPNLISSCLSRKWGEMLRDVWTVEQRKWNSLSSEQAAAKLLSRKRCELLSTALSSSHML